jgi:hypothetical protein
MSYKSSLFLSFLRIIVEVRLILDIVDLIYLLS